MAGKTHRLVVSAEDGIVMLRCDRGDMAQGMGETCTPDEIASAAAEHWGTKSGWMA